MKFIRKTVNPTQSISLQMIVNIQILLKAKSIKLHSQIIKKQYYNKIQPIIALIFKIMMIIIIILIFNKHKNNYWITNILIFQDKMGKFPIEQMVIAINKLVFIWPQIWESKIRQIQLKLKKNIQV